MPRGGGPGVTAYDEIDITALGDDFRTVLVVRPWGSKIVATFWNHEKVEIWSDWGWEEPA